MRHNNYDNINNTVWAQGRAHVGYVGTGTCIWMKGVLNVNVIDIIVDRDRIE